MIDERLIVAIGRLEQAIAGLERRLPAALAESRAASLVTATPVADESLHARHEALRARTAAAVARLSLLLETTGEG